LTRPESGEKSQISAGVRERHHASLARTPKRQQNYVWQDRLDRVERQQLSDGRPQKLEPIAAKYSPALPVAAGCHRIPPKRKPKGSKPLAVRGPGPPWSLSTFPAGFSPEAALRSKELQSFAKT
jgi:hypothetical protein